MSFSERCRQGPDFCCSPCSSPPRMNWIWTNPTRPGEHASPTTAPVSRKRSGIMSRLCADARALGFCLVYRVVRSYESCHLLFDELSSNASIDLLCDRCISYIMFIILWPAYEDSSYLMMSCFWCIERDEWMWMMMVMIPPSLSASKAGVSTLGGKCYCKKKKNC